jgi:hypothetical protein
MNIVWVQPYHGADCGSSNIFCSHKLKGCLQHG